MKCKTEVLVDKLGDACTGEQFTTIMAALNFMIARCLFYASAGVGTDEGLEIVTRQIRQHLAFLAENPQIAAHELPTTTKQ